MSISQIKSKFYNCSHKNCSIFRVRIPLLLGESFGGNCPSCKSKLDEQESFSIEGLNLPDPLIELERKYRNLKDPDSMVKALTDLYTFATKHLCFVSEGAYLDSGLKSEELEKSRKEFRLPYLSTYTSWLEDFEKFVKLTHPDSPAKEIAILYEKLESKLEKKKKIRTDGGYYDISGDWVTTSGELGIFKGLLNFRNTSTHFFNPRDREAMEVIAIYEPYVYTLLREMAELSCIELKNEGQKVYSKKGFLIPSILFIKSEFYYYEQYDKGNKVQFLTVSGKEIVLDEKEWWN